MFEINYYTAWKNKNEKDLIQLCQSDFIHFESLDIGDSNIKNCIFYNFHQLFFIIFDEKINKKQIKDKEVNELLIFSYERNQFKLLLDLLTKIDKRTNIEDFLTFLVKNEIIYPESLLMDHLKEKTISIEKIEECIMITENEKIEESKKDPMFSILKFEDNKFDAWLKELNELKKINLVKKLESEMDTKENNKMRIKI